MTGESQALASKDRGRVVVTGAAGLVGQNLIPRLKTVGFADIVAIDKHRANARVLRELHPDIRVIEADLARDDGWQPHLAGARRLVISHAQIGGLDERAFTANNVTATERLLAVARTAGVEHIVHVSSSVISSAAVDLYTESKKAQEQRVLESGIPAAILRPTLMFGWFDRKHVGWLARFMARTPVFPIPGNGRYLRQPLYAGDFSSIVAAALDRRITGMHNVSGLDKIDYIDLIRELRSVLELRTPIVRIPYPLFRAALGTYAVFDRDPPFTVSQLEALATPDVFEVTDWPGIFGVTPTPLLEALRQTFRDPVHSSITLDF
ncbi:MAG TPA: NAD-dependent epimerase/dehydratase family protein [Bauldia sp.]|nr:NAD-dependent epimerase/dehydratase family protein [Bauldia sp.]